ncbi:MAG: tyrosine-type recombinase/integrase [Syntrophobacterales bacterium]|nr:tyrosine-type recombinase/integrase [Syntrophobacterales bacterium]
MADYRINGKKSLARAERSVRHLEETFEGVRVVSITTPQINKYIEKRQSEEAANASINRELSALKRMLNLGARQTPPKVDKVPYIPMLKENNIRTGFFEHEDFVTVRDALPEYLKSVITFAYNTAWRRSEILNLTWRNVDLKEGIVRLDPGETKNDEGRVVYLDAELLDMMADLQRKKAFGCPYVFHRNGNQIRDFRSAWANAFESAGISSMMFHDLRRTAIRNMIRAGIPERVAMTISGHKTRAVFDRYNIVSPEDLKEAARKRQEFNELQGSRLQNGYIGSFKEKRVVAISGATP